MPSKEESNVTRPLALLIKFGLNILVVWAMAAYLDQFFQLRGGFFAIIAIGALITLLNFIVRPIIAVITMPLKWFATLLAVIVANAGFIWLLMFISSAMDQNIVSLQIYGGLFGWIVVAVLLGVSNWLMKVMLR